MSSTSGATQVGELVRALALGWKNLAAYPPGHPALANSLESIHQRLKLLGGPAGEVILGIANDGLMFGEDKIDSLTAQKFAQALYARGVAVLRFANETDAHDIEVFLRLLAAGVPGEQTRPIWEELTSAGVMHINLQPVDYSGIRVTDDLESKPEEEPTLWDSILRALMEGRALSQDADFLNQKPQSADELTQMILRYIDTAMSAQPKFDPDATFGIRMLARPETTESVHQHVADAVGRAIGEANGAAKDTMLQQAVQLLQTLPQPLRGTVLQRIVATLAADVNAGAQLRRVVSELPRDEVLEALRYLSTMQNLSAHALNLIQSLAAMDTASRAAPPSSEVIGDVVRLFGEDDVDRFNTEDHTALLEKVTIHVPQVAEGDPAALERLGKRLETVADDALMRQVTRTMLDLLAALGSSQPPDALLERVEGVFRSDLNAGQFEDALEILHRLQEIAGAAEDGKLRQAVHASVGRLSTGDTVVALIRSIYTAPPEQARSLQRLIDLLGAGARKNLLFALADEPNRSHRRRLFDFILNLGPVVVPEIVGCLSDSRWFVLRNMIVLLRAFEDRTSLPEIRRLAQHPDLRVRMEAIKSLFALDRNVSPDLLENLILDADPKVSQMAMSLIGSGGMREGVQPLLRVLRGNDIFGKRRGLRTKAIRTLGELGDPAALPGLRRFFRSSILPWPSREERLAAWESLSGYPADARAELIRIGERSRNPRIRDLCAEMGQHER